MSRIGITQALTYAQARPRITNSFAGIDSMTRQDGAEMVNINNIVRKTQLGQIPIGSNKLPQYGDFSMALTYDQALNRIMEAKDAFMELPAEERKQYGHDPERYYMEKLQEAQEQAEELQRDQDAEFAAKSHQKALQDARALLGQSTED